MDNAIQTANERLLYVTGDEDAQRAYLVRFRAMCDMTSAINSSHREGLEEGLAKGREEGLTQGREEGIAKGREEGMAKDKLEVAKKALAKGLSVEMIHEITELDIETIRRLNS